MIHRVFSGGSVVKNPPLVQEMQETWVQSLVQEDPLDKEKTNHSNILPCEITCTGGAWWDSVHGAAELHRTK